MPGEKVLIIDDETELVELMRMRLEANGYKVGFAYDGEAGLEKARSEKPDLIILDIMLPKKDGYKVCELLKNDAAFSRIKIIIFTARAQQEDLKRGREAGADAYITKPFDPQALLSKIRELLPGG